jgi:hypothetical protein
MPPTVRSWHPVMCAERDHDPVEVHQDAPDFGGHIQFPHAMRDHHEAG